MNLCPKPSIAQSAGKPVFLLIVFGVIVFANGLFNPFVHDDKVFILQNSRIHSLDVKSIFLDPSQWDVPNFAAVVGSYYRPMVELTHRLTYWASGFNPVGFHAVNIMLHIVNALLLYFLLKKILKSEDAFSFGISLVYLIHPLQAESVASIAGVSNILYALFLLLAVHQYIGAMESKSMVKGLACCVFYLLATLTKEQAIVFPALVLAYELILNSLALKDFKKKSLLWIGLLATAGIYFLFRLAVVGKMLGAGIHWDLETQLRFLTIPRTVLMFMGLAVYPSGLHYYRTINIQDPALGYFLMFSMLVIGLIALAVALPDRLKRIFFFGMAWFFIFMAPVLNIVPLVVEYSYILAMEHFIYFALAGLLIAFGSLVLFAFSYKPLKNILIGALGMVIFLFSMATVHINHTWSSEIGLWQRTLALGNPLGRAHHLLGKAYAEKGFYPQAVVEYLSALSIMRGYEEKSSSKAKAVYRHFMEDIYFDLGTVYQASGEHVFAIAHFKKALELDSQDPRVLNNMGISYFSRGEFDDAKAAFKAAVEADGHFVMALNNLGLCYLKEGNYPKAVNAFNQVLALNPRFESARENLNKLERFLNHE